MVYSQYNHTYCSRLALRFEEVWMEFHRLCVVKFKS